MGRPERNNTILIIAFMTMALAWFMEPIIASTTAFIDKAQTFTVMPTMSAGIKLSATTVAAPGSGTFLRKDADTGCYQQWQDGALGWQLCTSRVIPPDCAAAVPTLEFGAFCKDQTSGRIIMNAGTGLVYVTGDPL